MESTAKEIWSKMLPLLEKEVTILCYDVWIRTLEPVRITDGRLVLCVPSQSGKEFIGTRLSDLLKRALQMVSDILVDIELIAKDEVNDYHSEDTYKIPEEPIKQVEPMNIIPKYNFENFVVGKSNRLAYTAAYAIAEEPGIRYNPLFIYGGAGLGKTHLMHAIGNHIRVSKPEKRVLFVSSNNFVNDLVACIGVGNKGSAFREKYRGVDVLMVDDIQFIAGKPATTEEIFHTFNDLYNNEKQLVFTSDREPKDIPDIDARLRSRFEWGFTADIQPPDLETRIAILRKKAQLLKYNVSMEVLEYMAGCIDTNVREMEGLLNKVLMLSQLEDTSPSIEIVNEAIKVNAPMQKEGVTPEDIISAVCNLFGVKKEDLIGKKKTREATEPRQLCIYCMTEMLDLPLAAIGNIFGGRDHTTILYARDKIAEKIIIDQKTKRNIDNIKDMAYNR